MRRVAWAFLVVGVVAAAAVLAVRRPQAGQLPEPTPDQYPASVPEGPLTAADLHAVRFPLVFRGYRPDDVDALLDRLAAQLPEGEQAEPAPPPVAAPAAEDSPR